MVNYINSFVLRLRLTQKRLNPNASIWVPQVGDKVIAL